MLVADQNAELMALRKTVNNNRDAISVDVPVGSIYINVINSTYLITTWWITSRYVVNQSVKRSNELLKQHMHVYNSNR